MQNLITYKEFLDDDMPNDIRKDIYGDVLDLGCGDAIHLFDAQQVVYDGYSTEGNFVGIDAFLEDDFYRIYRLFMRSISTVMDDNMQILDDDDFRDIFHFETINMLEYHIQQEGYGIILARNSLHFLNKEDRIEMVEHIYNGLKRGGMFDFRILVNAPSRDSRKIASIEEVEQEWQAIFGEHDEFHVRLHPDDEYTYLSGVYIKK